MIHAQQSEAAAAATRLHLAQQQGERSAKMFFQESEEERGRERKRERGEREDSNNLHDHAPFIDHRLSNCGAESRNQWGKAP